jgi:hypothetical protein
MTSDLFAAVDLPLCPRSGHKPKRERQVPAPRIQLEPWYRTFCPVCQTVGCGATTQEKADIAWRTLAERWGK